MVHHCRGLRKLLESELKSQEDSEQQIETLLNQLQSDPKSANVNDADKALLSYAIRLTRQPESVSQDDIDLLRSHGFDDLAIHDLACCVGYFAFVNRIADGLGVRLEQD